MPSLSMTKDCVSGEIFPGDTASFRIRVQNTGNVPLTVDLTDVPAGIDLQDVQLGIGTCVFDADPADGCLEIDAFVTAGLSDVSNTVDATGTFQSTVIPKQATAVCPVSKHDTDAALSAPLVPSEYSRIPVGAVPSVELGGGATVANVGALPVTNVTVTGDYDLGGAPLATSAAAPIATLAPGASQAVAVPTVSAPTSLGQIGVTYTVSIDETDGGPSNDSVSTLGPLITSDEFARDDDVRTSNLGIGAGNGGEIGTSFSLPAPATLTAVRFFIAPDPGSPGDPGYPNEDIVGTSLSAKIRDMSGTDGRPNLELGATVPFVVPDMTHRWVEVAMAGGPLSLPAGKFHVSVVEQTLTLPLGMSDQLFTPGTSWVNWPTSPFGGWANVEQFGPAFAKQPMVRAIFATSATPTPTPTSTPTETPVPPTSTPTDTPTNTPVVPTSTPTDTPTNTPVPPTSTPTDTPTNTPPVPTPTSTSTPTNTPPSTPTSVATSSCLGKGLKRIHGSVTVQGENLGLGGVGMTLDGPDGCRDVLTTATGTASRDGGFRFGRPGKYRFPALAPGTYTVTPSKPGCTFSPPSATVALTTRARLDFAATCP